VTRDTIITILLPDHRHRRDRRGRRRAPDRRDVGLFQCPRVAPAPAGVRAAGPAADERRRPVGAQGEVALDGEVSTTSSWRRCGRRGCRSTQCLIRGSGTVWAGHQSGDVSGPATRGKGAAASAAGSAPAATSFAWQERPAEGDADRFYRHDLSCLDTTASLALVSQSPAAAHSSRGSVLQVPRLSAGVRRAVG